jgi:hypothetical protein
LGGRDFCLYCGRRFTALYVTDARGRRRPVLERDHMDPIAWGGALDEFEGLHDDNRDPHIAARNTVWCCRECNQRKGDMPFVDWLATLESRYCRLTRKVYTEKHGYPPEAFGPHRVVNGYG